MITGNSPISKRRFFTPSPEKAIRALSKSKLSAYLSQEAMDETENPCIELLAGWNKNGQVEVCVKDNGQGISKDLLDEIFVPFFTTRKNGSGIGLSLSRQILRLHNGSLNVRSVPDKETLFCMLFNE